ncbi:MAG: alpha/beta hydrolase [Candidatus Binatia bacterium]
MKIPGATETDLFMPAKSKTLAYLIHGVTGTPAEMKYVGRKLWQSGYDVYLPTLPGHCAKIRDLLRSNEEDWIEHVVKQLSFLRKRYAHVFAAGLSAGALLALKASTRVRLDGIGVFSPTFFYDGWNVPRTRILLDLAIRWFPRPLHYVVFHCDGFPYGIKNPALQARLRAAYNPMNRLLSAFRKRPSPRHYSSDAVGYPVFFLKTLADLDRLYDVVTADLPKIIAPTLVLQSSEDDFTSVRNSEFVLSRIASAEKKLVLLDDSYHVITVDRQRDRVAQELQDFIAAHTNPIPTTDLSVAQR